MRILAYGTIDYVTSSPNDDGLITLLKVLSKSVRRGDTLHTYTDPASAMLLHQWATAAGVNLCIEPEAPPSKKEFAAMVDQALASGIEFVIVFSGDKMAKVVQRRALEAAVPILIIGPWRSVR